MIGLSLLWVYLRRHDAFARFRNTILLANMIGLVGYVVVPTAPPWMFPTFGFVDGVNHQRASARSPNPYAAMPSLHAADALIVGIFLFRASPQLVVEGDLGALARLGLVLRARDGQPLLARRGRRASWWRSSRSWIVSRVARRRAQPAEARPIANLL